MCVYKKVIKSIPCVCALKFLTLYWPNQLSVSLCLCSLWNLLLQRKLLHRSVLSIIFWFCNKHTLNRQPCMIRRVATRKFSRQTCNKTKVITFSSNVSYNFNTKQVKVVWVIYVIRIKHSYHFYLFKHTPILMTKYRVLYGILYT